MRKIIFTCEHGGNSIPDKFQEFFKGHEQVLVSHRGWDIGALQIAKRLHKKLESDFFYATHSRLLVELNRSLHHPGLFSSFTKALSSTAKDEILEEYYFPYRNKVVQAVEKAISEKREVLHISVHSFTPELDGKLRNADIGLLYDPRRKSEKGYCKAWGDQLIQGSGFRVRYNYPYRGTADGFTTYLRKQFAKGYSGIELEVNQGILQDAIEKEKMGTALEQSLGVLFG